MLALHGWARRLPHLRYPSTLLPLVSLQLVDQPRAWSRVRPTTAKMVLYYERPAKRLAVHVDPEFPSAWQGEPYYRQLKAWTCAAIDLARAPSSDAWLMAPILVYVNDRAIVMLPNRDIEVGTFTPGSQLVVTEKATAAGPDFDACIMPSSDVPPA